MFLPMFSWFNLPPVADTYTSPGIGTTTGILSMTQDFTSSFFNSWAGAILGVAVGVPIAIIGLIWLINTLKRPVLDLFGGYSRSSYKHKMRGVNRRIASPFVWNDRFKNDIDSYSGNYGNRSINRKYW